MESRIEEIAQRVWPGRAVEIEPLGGGITNRNFKVACDGEAFVLRIGGGDTELLGIDRRSEHAATLVAAAAGVGPEVTAFLEPECYLVTRFIAGRPAPPKELRGRLPEVARTLRLVHDGDSVPGRFDSFAVVDSYRAIAESRGVRVPSAHGRASALAARIRRARGPQPDRPCHNDLLNANFLDDGGRLRIVDWEYAGMGDVFFDVANFSVNHELDDAGDRELLAAYFGDATPGDLASLWLMRFMSDFREAMWGVVQEAISQLEFDFRGYAEQHFDRLGATAADPRFGEALARVEAGP